MGLHDMVSPVAASVLEGRGKTPVDLAAVYIRQQYAGSFQVTDVFPKMFHDQVKAALSKGLELKLFINGKSHVSAAAGINNKIAERGVVQAQRFMFVIWNIDYGMQLMKCSVD
jgi:hypothetical protein